jgi:hypothetical protein
MAIDLDAIRRRVQELQSGRKTSNVQLWKPKLGEYVVRGIPWPEKYVQDGQPFVERWFYYIGDGGPGLLAPHQFGKPDPINDFVNAMWKSGKPEDREIAKKLRPKMQAYIPVIVKKGAEADPTKVLIWSMNKFIHQKLLSWFLKEDVNDYLDVVNGFDIEVKIVDSGKKFNNRPVPNTDVDLARRPSKLAATEDEVKKLFESVPNIDDMYRLKSPAELETALHNWLNGPSQSEPDNDGTEKTSTSGSDALDALVNEVKGSSSNVDESKDEKKKTSLKSKKKDDEEPAVKKSLDEAFDELMGDE